MHATLSFQNSAQNYVLVLAQKVPSPIDLDKVFLSIQVQDEIRSNRITNGLVADQYIDSLKGPEVGHQRCTLLPLEFPNSYD
ncbi:unnamed protein product [Diamesa serratosioi]